MHKSGFQLMGLAAMAAGIFLLAGCQDDPRVDPKVSYISNTPHDSPGYDNVSYWDGNNMNGAPSIKISLSEQRAYFYKGDKLAGVSWISTGREGLNTVTGNFHIIQKDKDHKSSVYGDYVDKDGKVVQKDVEKGKDPVPPGAHFDGSPMPFFMRIVGGTGMHQGFLPGVPASHGCIRMPGNMAEDFFNSVSVGTPVTIAP
ncbi:MAG TPA: L,D-transpeptidase family protein [Chthoniobacteraceae bacterium]|nr:L,D-transpeptidase family protein [Chthoniobacteraceae bacterium]